MKVYISAKGEIKDVGTTTNETLTAVEIPDDIFGNRTVAEICCYKVILKDGKYVGYTPYIDTKIIENIRKLAEKNAELEEQNLLISSTVDSILTDVIPGLMGL